MGMNFCGYEFCAYGGVWLHVNYFFENNPHSRIRLGSSYMNWYSPLCFGHSISPNPVGVDIPCSIII